MRYLTLNEVLEVHRQVMVQSGGAEGLIHLPALEFALAQPQMTFDSADLPSLSLGRHLVKPTTFYPDA